MKIIASLQSQNPSMVLAYDELINLGRHEKKLIEINDALWSNLNENISDCITGKSNEWFSDEADICV